MADVESNIHVNIDTSDALASLKLLQRQISAFHSQMSKSGAAASAVSANQAQNLMNSINATGKFQASMQTVKSSTESFTDALEKNKLTSREYFRYTGAATKTFGKLFKSEFDTISKVARERVKDVQTQYIKMGRGANGALQSIAVRPLTLDMKNLGTQTAMAAQKQQLLNQLLKQGSTNLLNFGKNTQWAGRQLMVGFTVPLVLLGSSAAKTFMQLEEQAIRFKRVYGDMFTTKEQTDEMVDNLQRLAREYTKYGVAVEETMKMAADAAAQGKMGADLMGQVAQATRLAVLGGVEQEQALETTISVTNAFGVATEDLAKKIDFLNAVENQTVVSIEDLTIAIPKAGPVVQQLGGDVEDLAFFLTAMKEGGINASEGANALKSGLASLINPSEKASKMLMGLGVNIKGIVEANAGDVKGTVIDFSKALDTLDPLNRARAIEQLFGKFQFSRLSTLFQNVTAQGTQASRVLELTKATTEELAILSERELGKIEETTTYKFKKSIEDLKVTLAPVGEQFLKALTPIVEFAAKILDKFNDLGDGSKKFITILTVALGAIGPLALMSFGLLANGVANIIKLFTTLRGGFQRAGSSTQVLGEQTNYLTKEQLEASAVAASLDQVHQRLKQTFTSEASSVNALTAAYQRAIAAQRGFGMPGAGRPGVSPKKFAEGGIISGPGGPKSDSVPIMASNGEAIISAEVVNKYPGLVQGLIANNIPGYKNSGIVTKPGGSVDFRGKSFMSTQATAPKIGNLIVEAQKLAGVVGNIDDIILQALTSVAKNGKITIGKFNAEMQALTDGAVKFRGGKLSGMASRTGDIQGGYAGNAGIVAAHGSPPINLTQAQAQELGREITSRVPGNSTGTALMNANSAGLRSNLTFPMPAAFNKGEMSGAEGAKFIGQNRARFTSMVAEQNGMNPNDPGLLDFGKRVGMALKKLGKTAVDDSQFYEIIKKELEVSLNSAAASTKKAGEALQKSATSYGTAQVMTPGGRGKGDRMSMPRAARGISVPGNIGKALAGESYRSQDISAGNASADKFIVKSLRKRIRNIFVNLESGVKEELQIASPSKKMKKAGRDAGAGLVQGAREYVDDARATGQALGSATVQGSQSMAAASRTALYGTGPIDANQKSLRRQIERQQKRRSALGKDVGYPSSVVSGGMADSAKKQTVSSRMSTFAQNVKDRRAARKESGTGMGAGGKMMAASGVMMAASMAPGAVGDMAQKLMMPMMALSMIMPLLASTTGIAVVALGAVAATLYMFDRGIKKARQSGIELAESMTMTSKKLQSLSEITGKVSATESADRRRQNILTGESGVQRKFGQNILGSGFGKTLLADIEKQAQSGQGINQIGTNISNSLAYAIVQGIITTDQARSISSALGEELKSYEIPAIVSGKLTSLFGPNGENLATDPLQITLAIQKESMQRQADFFKTALGAVKPITGLSAPQIMAGSTAAGAAIGSAIPGVGTVIGAGVGAVGGIGAAYADNKNKQNNNKLGAAAIQLGLEQVTMNNGLVDSLNKQYDTKVSMAKTDKEIQEIERQRAAALETLNAKNAEALGLLIAQKDAFGPDVFTNGINAAVDALYKEGPMKVFADEAKKSLNKVKDADFKAMLQVEFASGALDPITVTKLANNKEIQSSFKLMVKTQGAEDANLILQLLMKAGVKDQNIPIIMDIINNDPKNFDKNMDAIAVLGNMQQKYGVTVDLNVDGAAKMKAVSEITEKLKATKNSELSKEAFFDLGISGTMTAEEMDKLWTTLVGTSSTINKSVIVDFVAAGDMNVWNAYQTAIKAKPIPGGITLQPSKAQMAEARAYLVGRQGKVVEDKKKGGGVVGGGEKDKIESSPLDELVKKLRDVRMNQLMVTKGFVASSKALNNLFGGNKGISIFSGIENDMRKLGAGEDLIDLITGMDPAEYEAQKNKLFTFKDGNMVGLKDTAQSIGDALQSIKLGEFVSEQERMANQIGNQTTALVRLKAAGIQGSVALEAVSDATFAAVIANKNLSDKKIKEIAASWKIATAEKRNYIGLQALEAEEAELDANVDLLKVMTETMGQFTQEQISAIMQSENLKTALVNLASVKPGTAGYKRFLEVLTKAINKEKVQIQVDLVSIEGMQKVFDRGFANAMEQADVKENGLQLTFDADTADLQKSIDLAQDKIDGAQYDIDDKQAALREIEKQEEKINEKYDERIKALDEVEKANSAISAQQKGQLSLAEALTSGDIAAAARAAQDMRAQQAADAVTKEKEALEKSRQGELNNVTKDGKTRKDLEKEIKDLEDYIFNLEEKDIEPAEDKIRKFAIPLREAVRDLDKFRRYWEGLQNQIDSARTNSKKFLDEMKLAESVVARLADLYSKETSDPIIPAGGITGNSTGTTAEVPTKKPTGTPAEVPTGKPTGTTAEVPTEKPTGNPAGNPTGNTTVNTPTATTSGVITSQDTVVQAHLKDLGNIAEDAAKNLVLFNQAMNVRSAEKSVGTVAALHLDSLYKQQNAAVIASAMKPTAGMIAQEKAVAAGAAKLASATKAASAPKSLFSMPSGIGKGYSMGGLVKYFSAGGFARGTDTVPAMLTPGEFVMSKYAVDSYGVDNLKKINNGEATGGAVYNNTYTLTVNAKTNANPNDIAQAVMSTIKRVDDRRIRGVSING